MTQKIYTMTTVKQYQGFPGDGPYLHFSIPVSLDAHYNKKGFATQYPMHVAWTVGTAMRNPKAPHARKMDWINDLTVVISKANNHINFGQAWYHINEVRLYLYIFSTCNVQYFVYHKDYSSLFAW